LLQGLLLVEQWDTSVSAEIGKPREIRRIQYDGKDGTESQLNALYACFAADGGESITPLDKSYKALSRSEAELLW
jgi:hypothetical protein